MEPVSSATKDWSDRDWTVADAYAYLPESGTRHFEVIDGELVVTPRHPTPTSDGSSTSRSFSTEPLLVVEVLSTSNRRHDVVRKRTVQEELGVPAYWVVDPLVPSVTVLELVGGRYVELARGGPGESVALAVPFPMRLAPGEWTQLS